MASKNYPDCHEDKPCFAKRRGGCSCLSDTRFNYPCPFRKEMDAEQLAELKASLRGYNNK